MSVIDALITDRTAAEVAELAAVRDIPYTDMTAAQKTIYLTGLGGYRHTDFNRVGQACAYIYDKLTAAAYTVPDYVALRTNWTRGERPTFEEAEQYLATVTALKSVFQTATPLPSTMRRLSYEDANNIEKLLAELDELIDRIRSIYVRSGVYHSGAVFYIAEAIT